MFKGAGNDLVKYFNTEKKYSCHGKPGNIRYSDHLQAFKSQGNEHNL